MRSDVIDEPSEIAMRTVGSPIGDLLLVATDTALLRVCLPQSRDMNRVDQRWGYRPNAILELAKVQLREYFAGVRRQFEVPFDARGTLFQQRVWRSLRQIPYGQTRSYRQVAHHIGSPQATRAVGAANAANPIAIVIPCHRVIGSDGTLTGFGGGLPIKKFLLTLERSSVGDSPQISLL